MIKIVRAWILIVILLLFIVNFSVEARDDEGLIYDIKLDIKENGDLLVEEEITYEFKEKSSISGQRKLDKTNFTNIKFISLKAKNSVILDQAIKESRESIDIKWGFPKSSDSPTFILKYKIIGGIKSAKDKNVFTYNIFSGEKKPIKDINVTINFPEKFVGSEVYPEADLVQEEEKVIKIRHGELSPKEGYQVQIKFDKIIDLGIDIPAFHLPALLIGLTLGLLIILYDIFKTINQKREPRTISIQLKELNYIERGLIYYPESKYWKKGIIAALFSLAQQNKIKIKTHLKKTLWGANRKKQVSIEILDENLKKWEKELINKIQKKKTLKRFFKDEGLIKEVLNDNRASLIDKGIYSQKYLKEKRRIYISGLFLLIPGLLTLAAGYWLSLFPLLGLGYLFLTIGLGRFVKRLFLPQLTPGGLYLQEQLEAQTDQVKDVLEIRLEKAPSAGFYRLLRELPRLILHHELNVTVLNHYLQSLYNLETVSYPAWFEIDLSSISDLTLNDLKTEEKLKYMLLGVSQSLKQI